MINEKENKRNKLLNLILSPINANIIDDKHPIILNNAVVSCK